MKTLYNTSAPSVIWRIDCLTDEEKIVLFNICHFLKNKHSEKSGLDCWLLAYISGKDCSVVHKVAQSLVEKDFLINDSKYYLNVEKIKSYATDRDFVKEEGVVGNFVRYTKGE